MNMAVQYLRRATNIDPNFAMAYVYQTHVHAALRQEEQSFRAASRAFSLRDSLNERQRLQTEAMYYSACGDIDQTIESQKILVDKYPSEAQLHRHLAQACALANRVEDAVQQARLAAKLESRSAINYMILASALAQAGQFFDAHQVLYDGRSQ